MEQVFTHLKPFWPAIGATTGFVLALIIGIRYKIPDLTRRMEALEALERKRPKNSDLDHAIDGFHTVCRFNQVTCQKEIEHKTAGLGRDLDKKLAVMHEKVNGLAISNADVGAKIELLLNGHDGLKN